MTDVCNLKTYYIELENGDVAEVYAFNRFGAECEARNKERRIRNQKMLCDILTPGYDKFDISNLHTY